MSFFGLIALSPYLKSHAALGLIVAYAWYSNYTTLITFGFIAYLALRVVLTTGEDVKYGDLRRKPTWKQQKLPENILADFEYFFIPTSDERLFITSDSGTGTYEETKPRSLIIQETLKKATPAPTETSVSSNSNVVAYAGTGYAPSSNARLSPRDESPGAGRMIFSQSYRIKGQKPKAVIVQCHGYGDHTSWYLRDEAIMWAQRGFAVHAMDSCGNGRSDGLQNYIPSLKIIVDDFVEIITQLKSRYSPDTKFFIVGHSMGGALALHLAWRLPYIISGLVLIAPMVKIVESLKPPKPVVQALTFLASLWPTGPVTPLPDLIHHCFSNDTVLQCRMRDPIRLKIKSRLASALEMVRVTEDFEKRLKEVSVPFVVVHGRDDKVTACDVSEALYKQASSSDKKFIKLDGALHCVFQYNGIAHGPSIQLLDQLAEWVIQRS